MTEIQMLPIGYVRGGRSAVEDDDWAEVKSTIELDTEQMEPQALAGLDTFSHVEVVFVFDRVDPAAVCRGSRHPRGNTEWPEVGILAQRAKDRPNRIGVTVCRLVGLRDAGIEVAGLDAVDGTPVLDVKPYMSDFGPQGSFREPAWCRELMEGYWSTDDIVHPCPAVDRS